MPIQPIHTDRDHEAALARVREIWNCAEDTVEFAELEVLGVLIDAYERRRWPSGPADPIDMLKFHMDQNGLRQKDLGIIIGSESRASEIMNRKRSLTVEMIRSIAGAWHIPADLLIGPPAPVTRQSA